MITLKIMMLALATDQQVLAMTLLGEARNQGVEGMTAVASVICNRSRQQSRPMRKICLQPKQFSCWNGKGVDAKLLMTAQGAQAMRIAEWALTHRLVDNTGNATHYHTIRISPKWNRDMIKTKIIRDHVFWRTK